MNKLNSMSETELAALALELADRNGPVANSIALLEFAADALRKIGRLRSADACLQVSRELREKIDLPRPSIVGIDHLIGTASTDESDRGRELLVAIERTARRVIEREAVAGGLIHRAIQEGVRHV